MGGGDGGADDNLPVGKCENIGWRRITEVKLVQTPTFPGGDQHDSDFGGETAATRGWQAREGALNPATEERESQRMETLAIAPVDLDCFCWHGGRWDNGCGGGG